jgi:hypothetical protein
LPQGKTVGQIDVSYRKNDNYPARSCMMSHSVSVVRLVQLVLLYFVVADATPVAAVVFGGRRGTGVVVAVFDNRPPV